MTFGCLNRLIKIWPALPLFGRLLAGLPGARLIMKAREIADISIRERVMHALLNSGAAPGQIELRGPTSAREHLETLHDIDISLDTFPQTGGVTTLESLWLGVPVVTLTDVAGVSPRSTASLLTVLGLSDCVAKDRAGYVEIAMRLAADLPRLAAFRAAMRARLENSIVCDAAGYTGAVEAAYRSMWIRWLGDR